jgi:hypothetical protein
MIMIVMTISIRCCDNASISFSPVEYRYSAGVFIRIYAIGDMQSVFCLTLISIVKS